MIWCTIKGYDLYNFPFDFVGKDAGNHKNSQSGKIWSLVNEIHLHGLLSMASSPTRLVRLLATIPSLILLAIRLKINSACIHYLTSKYYYTLDEEERRRFLISNIWGAAPGGNWNRALEEVYASRPEFTEVREPLIDAIVSLGDDEYDGVIEIGTGNGWFLDLLSKKIDRNIPFIGLDLNRETIERTRSRYGKSRKLEFVCSDILSFTKTESLTHKLLVTCFVLECFSPEELVGLCALLKREAPCHLAIIERVNSTHEAEALSKPIGGFSYSHDYEMILKRAGIEKQYSRKDTAKNPGSNFNLTAVFKAVPESRTCQ